MNSDSELPRRRSIRLKGWDYRTAGAYSITLCAQHKLFLFGEITDAEMHLNEAGRMVVRWWEELNRKFSVVQTDASVVMPNHLHGILVIVGENPLVRPQGTPLSRIVQWFKTMTTNEYIRSVKQWGWPPIQGRLWQRNYYEHVIRNDEDLNRTRRYIAENPLRWGGDPENVGADLRVHPRHSD